MSHKLKILSTAVIVAILVYVLTVAFHQNIYHGEDRTGIDEKRIDTIVAKAMEAFHVPGIAIGIVEGNTLSFAKGYGVADVDTGVAVTPDTVFGIASHSKAYTTGALALLVDQGIISWDDKVQKWIPEFELYDPWVTEHFTIRDLLSHRSGLPLGAGDLMWWPNPNFTRQNIIDGLKHLKPTSEFRTKYDYDNLLYVVAGEIVTRASGKPWEDFVTDTIFTPLGMDGCWALPEDIPEGIAMATPHAYVDDALQTTFFQRGEPSSSAAAVNCNVKSHAKWVGLQLNEGKLPNGDVLISKKQHNEMWKPQTIQNVSGTMKRMANSHFAAYGLGWAVTDVHGRLMVSHSGGLQGMVTYTIMLPEENLGVIVLTNAMSGAAIRSIAFQIMEDYIAGDSGNDWVQFYNDAMATSQQNADAEVEAAAATRENAGVMHHPIEKYLGTYNDPWYGDITILTELKDGIPHIDMTNTPLLKGTLEPFDGNTFIARWDDRSLEADAYVIFEENEQGKITGATMRAVSDLTDFSFDFHHLTMTKVVR